MLAIVLDGTASLCCRRALVNATADAYRQWSAEANWFGTDGSCVIGVILSELSRGTPGHPDDQPERIPMANTDPTPHPESGAPDSPGAAAYDGTDFYCDVAIPGVQPIKIVHDDDRVLAFHHTRPLWDVHIVVVPKRHIASFTTIGPQDERDVRALFSVVQFVAKDVETRYGAAAVLTNLGTYQDSKHLHVHVHSGPERGMADASTAPPDQQ